jgi:CBS domain-containing protein
MAVSSGRRSQGHCAAGGRRPQAAAGRRAGPCFPFDRLSDRIESGFAFKHEGTTMRVSDILKVKGNTLFTVTPDKPLREAVDTMAEHDIGSLVVMEYGDLVGMLTFREIILRLHVNGGAIGDVQVRKVMDEPLTCTPETDVNEVRRMMLERHARYMPVLDKKVLMGVISFYDVAKTVVEAQSFENRMLKAYIRDWPESEAEAHKP